MSDDELLTHQTWADALRDGELLGQRCPECGHETAAPKAACGRCGSRALETVALPTAGTVYTETTMSVVPRGFEGPYQVGVVDLGEARVLARLEGEVAIGDRVELEGALEVDGEVAPLFS
ncbi:Zn-ribbon domain-containing OB-fold protein [Natronobeatus ordinarius]|uniref:Zn-ribbon domain-containing OB-fold protein n=1 Tax=Natronobeatus ordinarius TaxID=2963433 RepID=UPI0020CD56E7|nr:OB-fold domain-containing protein [Natronobeatus ordinarius]